MSTLSRMSTHNKSTMAVLRNALLNHVYSAPAMICREGCGSRNVASQRRRPATYRSTSIGVKSTLSYHKCLPRNQPCIVFESWQRLPSCLNALIKDFLVVLLHSTSSTTLQLDCFSYTAQHVFQHSHTNSFVPWNFLQTSVRGAEQYVHIQGQIC